MQPDSQPSNNKTRRLWYRNRSFVCLVIGFIVGLILFSVIAYGYSHRGSQTKLSCHQPTTQSTQTQYCVYYKRGQIVIGTAGNRGLHYTVPYELKDVSVSWDNNTDAATITMPGTKLIVQASEYVSKR